eukprot:1160121-Pelagomonas_calceolata.AAC.1
MRFQDTELNVHPEKGARNGEYQPRHKNNSTSKFEAQRQSKARQLNQVLQQSDYCLANNLLAHIWSSVSGKTTVLLKDRTAEH